MKVDLMREKAKLRNTNSVYFVDALAHNIYLNEHLTASNRKKFAEARKQREDGEFEFVWVKSGHNYIREEERKPARCTKNKKSGKANKTSTVLIVNGVADMINSDIRYLINIPKKNLETSATQFTAYCAIQSWPVHEPFEVQCAFHSTKKPFYGMCLQNGSSPTLTTNAYELWIPHSNQVLSDGCYQWVNPLQKPQILKAGGISCYQCVSTDHVSPFQCNEYLSSDIDLEPQACDAVFEAQYCIKHTGRFEVGSIDCYQCSAASDLGCSDELIQGGSTSCDHVFEARYCIKTTGFYAGSLYTVAKPGSLGSSGSPQDWYLLIDILARVAPKLAE
uniref:Uncharacterized protein n=1 Tax=Timema tahoe TaxID=61484 RepID=A0A7R9NZ04_9NEOP|nr:unnamed protein product [Timema tahoe]